MNPEPLFRREHDGPMPPVVRSTAAWRSRCLLCSAPLMPDGWRWVSGTKACGDRMACAARRVPR